MRFGFSPAIKTNVILVCIFRKIVRGNKNIIKLSLCVGSTLFAHSFAAASASPLQFADVLLRVYATHWMAGYNNNPPLKPCRAKNNCTTIFVLFRWLGWELTRRRFSPSTVTWLRRIIASVFLIASTRRGTCTLRKCAKRTWDGICVKLTQIRWRAN